jgi:hypothetical protein
MKLHNKAIGMAVLLLLQVVGLPQAIADCKEPPMPAVPDGSAADKQTMLEAYREMRAYQARAQSFLDCIDALKVSEPDVDVEILLERLNAYNRTVENMDIVSRKVHAELDTFNTR